MKEKSLDIIYNKSYIVIVPTTSKTWYEGFEYSFKNVILMNETADDYDKTLTFLKKNNFKKLILVDYKVEYQNIISKYKNKSEIDFIYTGTLGSLAEEFKYDSLKKTISLFEQMPNSKLGLVDQGLYELLQKKYKNIYLISLDIEEAESCDAYIENQVGLLNDSTKPVHSYYNELSAITLSNKLKAKIINVNKTTKRFLKTFKIQYTKVKNEEELFEKNLANLYINFTDCNNLVILKSLDKKVPCIIGNNDIFDNYKYLKENLVVKSDDDVNEIFEKIKLISKNRKNILNEYQKFRKKYSRESIKSIETFLGTKKITKEENKKEHDLLLSVIFPVYNTANYIEKSLESVIKAAVPSMEILIINDGSTDNSEDIILKYVNKYPKLIKYIKQDNHGLGNVRNVGLKEAKGKYLAAVDSDDTINKNYFKEALKYLNNNIDIVMYDWLTVTDSAKYQTSAIDYIYGNIDRYRGILYTTIMPSTCNKIIKKEIFEKLKLNYLEDKYEDLSANPFALIKAETIKYINKPYYEYYIRSNSIMRARPGNSMMNAIKLVDERINKYKEYINVDIEEFKFNTYAWRIEEYIINPLYDLEENEMSESIIYLYKSIYDVIIGIFESKYYKTMLNKLNSQEIIEYINRRNQMIKDMKLEEFIKKQKEKDEIIKLTPPDVVYGKK